MQHFLFCDTNLDRLWSSGVELLDKYLNQALVVRVVCFGPELSTDEYHSSSTAIAPCDMADRGGAVLLRSAPEGLLIRRNSRNRKQWSKVNRRWPQKNNCYTCILSLPLFMESPLCLDVWGEQVRDVSCDLIRQPLVCTEH